MIFANRYLEIFFNVIVNGKGLKEIANISDKEWEGCGGSK